MSIMNLGRGNIGGSAGSKSPSSIAYLLLFILILPQVIAPVKEGIGLGLFDSEEHSSYNYYIRTSYKRMVEELVTSTIGKTIEFPIEEAFIRTYKLRRARPGADTVEVSVPRDFVRKLARKSGLLYSDCIKQYQAVVYYGLGDELLYRFERISNQQPQE